MLEEERKYLDQSMKDIKIFIEIKCVIISDNCLYSTGHRCINGACLDSQCHCNDGWGGKGCSMPDENECKYRWVLSQVSGRVCNTPLIFWQGYAASYQCLGPTRTLTTDHTIKWLDYCDFHVVCTTLLYPIFQTLWCVRTLHQQYRELRV